jgi:hypothetical protein
MMITHSHEMEWEVFFLEGEFRRKWRLWGLKVLALFP